MTFFSVAADDVGVLHLLEEGGDVSGVVLSVAVHHDADVAGGGVESEVECGALSEVFGECDDADAGLSGEFLRGGVGAAVVDGDDFGVGLCAFDFFNDGGDVFFFVVEGDDDGDFHFSLNSRQWKR